MIGRRETGVESVVHAQYLTACDVASSNVHKVLGVRSTGVGNQGYLLHILFRLDLSELAIPVSVRSRRISCVGYSLSINNSDRWVFYLSYDSSRGETPGDFTRERCEELIKLALSIQDVEVEIESIRLYVWSSSCSMDASFWRDMRRMNIIDPWSNNINSLSSSPPTHLSP